MLSPPVSAGASHVSMTTDAPEYWTRRIRGGEGAVAAEVAQTTCRIGPAPALFEAATLMLYIVKACMPDKVMMPVVSLVLLCNHTAVSFTAQAILYHTTLAPPSSQGAAHTSETVLHVFTVHVRFWGALGGTAAPVVIGPPTALALTPTVLEIVAETEYAVVAFSWENSACDTVAGTTVTETVALLLARKRCRLYCTSEPPPVSKGADHTANTELADAFFSVNASGGDGACSGAVATVMLIDDPLVPIPFVAVTVAL